MTGWNDRQTDTAAIIALLGQRVCLSVHLISDHLLSCLCHFPPLQQGSHVPGGKEDARTPSSRSESWRESSSTTFTSARTDALSCLAYWVWRTGALPSHTCFVSRKNTSYIIISVLCAARGFVQLKIPTWNAAAKGQPCCSWGLGAEVTVTSPTAGVLPLWQLCGIMPLPYWCLLSFKIMAVFFFF